MNNNILENLTIKGDLGYRIKKSFSRLESRWYKPNTAFADVANWPGDWPGRTILALVMLAKSSKAEPAYLDEILINLKKHLNSKNYLGNILPTGEFDEQQFSGHNWLLRALIEHYKWKKDEQSFFLAKEITENLFLPAYGFYKEYPSNPDRRNFEGDKSGSRTGNLINNWYTSTDVGCAFIPLDGLSEAYDLFRSEELYKLLQEMIEVFVKIDFVNVGMQTHATLSATRGIMQFYLTTGENKYLEYAKKIFSLYISEGMTENYANFNWFGKTDTWTEPCAVIDSYILAYKLFLATRNIEYLEISHKICYNAIYYAQRVNGGFGCDNCVGPENTVLRFNGDGIAEAYWCCTMRGADGLSNIAANSLEISNDIISFANYHNVSYSDEDIDLNVKTQFPKDGNVQINLYRKTPKIKYIEVYVPKYAVEPILTVDNNVLSTETGKMNRIAIRDNSVITLKFGINLEIRETIGNNARKDCVAVWHGSLLLGAKPDGKLTIPNLKDAIYEGDGTYKIGEKRFIPLDFNIDNESFSALDSQMQILFSK